MYYVRISASVLEVYMSVANVPAQVPVCVKLVSETRFGSFENAFIDRTVVSVTNHPLVVDYYYIFPMSQIYLSVMEYVPGVNLHEGSVYLVADSSS